MADTIKKNQIKYKDTVYTLEDARIPDPSGKSGKILGVNSNGQYELRDESSGGGSEGGGSSGGAVTSVNGKTGVVNLTAEDVGALPSSYQAPVTSVNGQTGDVVISGGGSGATISVDSSLDNESTNPVQNKVIKAALDNKVDKVTGKSLSTNDFTNTYKNALDNLDTTLSNKQDKLTAGSGINISNNVISATGSGGGTGSLEWIELKSEDVGLWGIESPDYFAAWYCPALKIVRFTMKKTISTNQNAGVDNLYSITEAFDQQKYYKPHCDLEYGGSWIPAFGVVTARPENTSNQFPVYVDLGYMVTDPSDYKYQFIFRMDRNSATIVASGFYYTENLPS